MSALPPKADIGIGTVYVATRHQAKALAAVLELDGLE
jgi:hypothetical protein